MPSTARTRPRSVTKAVQRSSTWSKGPSSSWTDGNDSLLSRARLTRCPDGCRSASAGGLLGDDVSDRRMRLGYRETDECEPPLDDRNRGHPDETVGQTGRSDIRKELAKQDPRRARPPRARRGPQNKGSIR